MDSIKLVLLRVERKSKPGFGYFSGNFEGFFKVKRVEDAGELKKNHPKYPVGQKILKSPGQKNS